ncbi:MAG: CHASE2 domain-containing protein [Ignavibacteriae bacterium]|nr:CHASE2 domain-containing protein [Ignavibacteriota bacterium]
MKKIQKIKESYTHQLLDRGKIILFITNVLLGILTSIFLGSLANTVHVSKYFNPKIDKLIKAESEKIVKKYIECHTGTSNACKELEEKITDKIIFIDIDDTAFSAWGEPVLTPRDKLANLIKIVAENNPEVIILDILLYDKARNIFDDEVLIEALENISNKDTIIIFPYTLSTNKIIKRSKITELESLIDKSHNFYRGLPLIMASGDGIIRYFSGYQVVKDKNDEKTVLWNVSVLATALYTNNFTKLKDQEKKILEIHEKKKKDYKVTINLSENKRIDITSEDIYTNRIRFFMRPPDLYNESRKGNLSLSQRRLVDLLLTDADSKNKDYIQGKIVIIGNSSLHKGDNFLTPVGYMKGMYVIGNTLNTLIHDDLQMTTSHRLSNVLFEFPILILFAFHFTFLFSFNKDSIKEWTYILVPSLIMITLYVLYSREAFFKLLLVISVLIIFNKWRNRLTITFEKHFKKIIKTILRRN